MVKQPGDKNVYLILSRSVMLHMGDNMSINCVDGHMLTCLGFCLSPSGLLVATVLFVYDRAVAVQLVLGNLR